MVFRAKVQRRKKNSCVFAPLREILIPAEAITLYIVVVIVGSNKTITIHPHVLEIHVDILIAITIGKIYLQRLVPV